MIVVVALATSSCVSTTARTVRRYLAPPRDLMCPDGAPVKVLQDPACANGVCGWTCAPRRWQP